MNLHPHDDGRVDDGWRSLMSRRYVGATYYFNVFTGQSQWTPPWTSVLSNSSNNKNSDNSIRQHYDEQATEAKESRTQSSILNLRNANNAVKTALINRVLSLLLSSENNTTKKQISVVDLACGKGGDLGKWRNLVIGRQKRIDEITFMGVDFSFRCIETARLRYEQTYKDDSFSATFKVSDMCSSDFTLSDERDFDLVSVQFALHYAFESDVRLDNLLSNVARLLRKGGLFFGTIPRFERILELDQKQKKHKMNTTVSVQGKNDQFLRLSNNFNRVLQAKEDKGKQKQEKWEEEFGCGLAYSFTLDGCVSECTEYLVSPTFFEHVAFRKGLLIKEWRHFEDYHVQKYAMSDDERDAFNLYTSFIFIKQY